MKIHDIKSGKAVRLAGEPKTNFEQFSKDLRSLSDYSGFKLVSLGAVATMDANGTMYLAIWQSDLEPIISAK